jgi:hypothetical protein
MMHGCNACVMSRDLMNYLSPFKMVFCNSVIYNCLIKSISPLRVKATSVTTF